MADIQLKFNKRSQFSDHLLKMIKPIIEDNKYSGKVDENAINAIISAITDSSKNSTEFQTALQSKSNDALQILIQECLTTFYETQYKSAKSAQKPDESIDTKTKSLVETIIARLTKKTKDNTSSSTSSKYTDNINDEELQKKLNEAIDTLSETATDANFEDDEKSSELTNTDIAQNFSSLQTFIGDQINGIRTNISSITESSSNIASNISSQLKTPFTDLKSNLTSQFTGMMKNVGSGMLTSIGGLFKSLGGITSLLKSINPTMLLIEIAMAAIQPVLDMIKEIIANIVQSLVDIVKMFLMPFQMLLDIIMDLVQFIGQLIAIAIYIVLLPIILLIKGVVLTIKAILLALMFIVLLILLIPILIIVAAVLWIIVNLIVFFILAVLAFIWIKQAIKDIIDDFLYYWDIICDWAENLWIDISNWWNQLPFVIWFKDWMDEIDKAGGFGSYIMNNLIAAWEGVKLFFIDLWNSFTVWFNDLWIVKELKEKWERLAKWWDGFSIKDLGSQIIDFIKNKLATITIPLPNGLDIIYKELDLGIVNFSMPIPTIKWKEWKPFENLAPKPINIDEIKTQAAQAVSAQGSPMATIKAAQDMNNTDLNDTVREFDEEINKKEKNESAYKKESLNQSKYLQRYLEDMNANINEKLNKPWVVPVPLPYEQKQMKW